jgi:succinate-semialdehyde dehydrogenase/glutarate-semialdehyde dehydrogenase
VAIVAINPTTGDTIKEYPEMTLEEVNRMVEQAQRAFLDWRETDFATRARLMREAARLLHNNVEEYTRLMAREMGKPIKDGRAEANKCAWACDYYAEKAEAFLQDE